MAGMPTGVVEIARTGLREGATSEMMEFVCTLWRSVRTCQGEGGDGEGKGGEERGETSGNSRRFAQENKQTRDNAKSRHL